MNKIKIMIFTFASLAVSAIKPLMGFCQEPSGASNVLFASELSTAKKLLDLFIEFAVTYGFQVLGGIVVLFLGTLIANSIAKFLKKFLEGKNVDLPVIKFLIAMAKAIIIGFALLVALGKFGITIAPFIAGLSVVGFASSFALQGPLSNYASGITLIFTKPFKVGDIIEVTGVMGEVQDMTLARTEVSTLDGTKIVIPNKQIIGEIIHNFSKLKKLDITVGVSYDADIKKAIAIVKDIISSDGRIAKKPEPRVGISEFADSSINIYSRIWCKQADYYDVMFAINMAIFEAFKKSNVTIPFPQRDVHIFEHGK